MLGLVAIQDVRLLLDAMLLLEELLKVLLDVAMALGRFAQRV